MADDAQELTDEEVEAPTHNSADGNGADLQPLAPEPLEPQPEVPAPPRRVQLPPRTEAAEVHRTITDKMVLRPNDLTRHQGRPDNRDTPKIMSDRQFLDELLLQPESIDYRLCVHRYSPTHTREGKRVPQDLVMKCSIMPYDTLKEAITEAVGGGEFRVYIQASGRGSIPNSKCILLSVPANIYPPKLERSLGEEGDKEVAVKANPEEEESVSLKEKRKMLREQIELDNLEERAQAAARRKAQEQMRAQIEMAQLQKMQREALGTDQPKSNDAVTAVLSQLSEMQRQIAENQKDTERKLAEERKAAQDRIDKSEAMMREMFKEVSANIVKVAESAKQVPPPPPLPDTGIKDVLVAMQNSAAQVQQQNSAMLAAIVPALAQKPDTGLKEVLVAMQGNQTQNQNNMTQLLGTVLPAIANRPDTGSQQLLEVMKTNTEMVMKATNKESNQQQAMINNLIGAVLNKGQSESTPEMVMRIMELGDKRFERAMSMAQQFGGGGGGSDEDNPADPEGYDEKVGFLGNAGRALYYGLKELPKLAVQHPQILNVITRIFGNANPTPEQMAAAAARMEVQNPQLAPGLPPPIQQPRQFPPMQQMRQLPMQQSGVVPPAFNVPQPVPQRALTPPPAPPVQQTPPPVQQTPPPVQAPAPQPRSVADQQQIDVATELEGEMTGIEVPPTTAAADESAEADAADARLRDAVSGSMAIAVANISDEVNHHEWPEDATDNWPKRFRDAIVSAPDHQQRISILQGKCDPEVWRKLTLLCAPVNGDNEATIAKKTEELLRFYRDLDEFIAMNKSKSPPPAPPPPVPQTPVEPAVIPTGVPTTVGPVSPTGTVSVPPTIITPTEPPPIITPTTTTGPSQSPLIPPAPVV